MGKAVRLDKFLADSGAGTRTEEKKLIQKGMVQENGETAKKPELKVDPERDVEEFGGERLGARAEFVYYHLHKPAGYEAPRRTSGKRRFWNWCQRMAGGIFFL